MMFTLSKLHFKNHIRMSRNQREISGCEQVCQWSVVTALGQDY